MTPFKLGRIIEEASRRPDPKEALRVLGETLRNGAQQQALAASRRARPQNLTLLAGIYLRAGLVDAAAELLFDDLASNPPPPADAIVLDPHYVFGGHFHLADQFYLRAITKAGLDAIFARPTDRMPVQGDWEGGAAALISMRLREVFALHIGSAEFESLNALFYEQFRRALPARRPRLTVVPTALHSFIGGLADYLAASDSGETASLLLGIHDEDWARTKRKRRFREPYRRAFDVLSSVPDLRVLIVAESEPIAEGVRQSIGREYEASVCPHVGGYLQSLEETDPEPGEGIVVGFVGQTSTKRGAHLIPEIARSTLAAKRAGLSWRAQLEMTRLTDILSPDGADALQEVLESDRFEAAAPRIATGDYQRLLCSIDLMVMPFAASYAVRSSGVAMESLRAGCVQILPEGSTMAHFAAEHGAGYVTFSEQTAAAVFAAVTEALDRFDELRQRSVRAAQMAGQGGAGLQRIMEFIESA